MKCFLNVIILVLLLVLHSIIPESYWYSIIFIGYCMPLKESNGVVKYVNIFLNILLMYALAFTPILTGKFFTSFNIINKLGLEIFAIYLPVSLLLLVALKFIYKYRISLYDLLIHIVALIVVNYLSNPFAIFFIEREHFREFEMSLRWIFLFIASYIIWKVHQHQTMNT